MEKHVMDHPLIDLIDQAVAAAEKRGEFDNLPGAGKPLANLDNPKDAILSKAMSEAGAKPTAVVLQNKIVQAQADLKQLSCEDARKAQMKVIADLQLRLSIEKEALRRFG